MKLFSKKFLFFHLTIYYDDSIFLFLPPTIDFWQICLLNRRKKIAVAEATVVKQEQQHTANN
jgi:hypothetical protein